MTSRGAVRGSLIPPLAKASGPPERISVMAPSYAQRIVLIVLARGGFLDPGTPGESSPRLYEADARWGARLFALVPRQTLVVLTRRGWVTSARGPTGRTRYVVSAVGCATSRRFQP